MRIARPASQLPVIIPQCVTQCWCHLERESGQICCRWKWLGLGECRWTSFKTQIERCQRECEARPITSQFRPQKAPLLSVTAITVKTSSCTVTACACGTSTYSSLCKLPLNTLHGCVMRQSMDVPSCRHGYSSHTKTDPHTYWHRLVQSNRHQDNDCNACTEKDLNGIRTKLGN